MSTREMRDYKSDLAYRRMIPAQFKDDMFTFRHINFGKHFLTGNRIGGKHLQLIPKPKAHVIFSSEGFHMNGVDYPVSLDVPEIQHVPVGSAYDEKRNLLYGVNSNWDGYFYKFDLDTKKWSTINGSSNMRGLSPIGVLFDSAADRLLMPVWYPASSSERLVIIQQNFYGTSRRIGFDRTAFEGLDDLSHDDEGWAPHITPVGVMGNTIILLASPSDMNAYDNERSYKDGLCGWTRLYFADMITGEVALVQHENRPDVIKAK